MSQARLCWLLWVNVARPAQARAPEHKKPPSAMLGGLLATLAIGGLGAMRNRQQSSATCQEIMPTGHQEVSVVLWL